jgi:conjugal transfer pilus assembly protein TraE
VLTIGVIWSMVSANRALRYQRTIILPPKVDDRIEITGTTVNDEYVKMYIRYTMSLMLDYQPQMVEDSFNDLLTLAAPEFFPMLKIQLHKIGESVKKLQVSSIYYIHTINVDQEKQKISVKGLRKQYTHTSLIENGKKEYEIEYRILNGRFYITDLQEVVSHANNN